MTSKDILVRVLIAALAVLSVIFLPSKIQESLLGSSARFSNLAQPVAPTRVPTDDCVLLADDGTPIEDICLQVSDDDDGVTFLMSTASSSAGGSVSLIPVLRMTASYVAGGGDVSLEAYYYPDLYDKMDSLGRIGERNTKEILFEETDAPMGTTWFSIGLPSGVLGKWFENRMLLAVAATGQQVPPDVIENFADIAASRADERFNLSSLNEKSQELRLYGGPIQAATIAISMVSIILIFATLLDSRLQSAASAMTELIPFTGFFGTLIGVSGGLSLLGKADISDDASKALNLGQIGGQLGIAIDTTIFAIMCFGLVMVVQAVVGLFRR